MNIPAVNNVSWQHGMLVLALNDKQYGLYIMQDKMPTMPYHKKQYRFLENLNSAESITTQAITRMIRQRNPK